MAETKPPLKPSDIQKLLSDPKYRIELHALVHKETEKVYKSIEALTVQTQDVEATAKKAIEDFETVTKNLRMIMAYGCYFGTKDQAYLWSGSLTRLSSMPQIGGSTFLLTLQLYPALLVMYASGLAALAAKNEVNLKTVFEVQSSSAARDAHPLVLEANCTMLGDAGNQLLGYERRKTPLSDHLFELLEATLPKELSFGQDFAQLFDSWEILVGMMVADQLKDRPFSNWAPVGRFSWRNEYSESTALKQVKKEVEEEKPTWPPFTAGLFGGSPIRLREAFSVVETIAKRVGFF